MLFRSGIVSFLTDVSSEMIAPLMPLFLSTTLGASPWALGLIEGLAEAIASVLKLNSGLWADRGISKKKMILIGYGISGALRPTIGFAQNWVDVLLIRSSDRIGKGLRTSPRDALIADSVDANSRGAAFGFHRAMDHAGAVVGPLVTTFLMIFFALTERQVFLWASIPAIFAFLVIIFWVKDEKNDAAQVVQKKTFSFAQFPPSFRWVLAALFVFTLGGSSDAFLLLKLHETGIATSTITLLWALFHIVKMLSSRWGGGLSDRWGRAKTLICGWTLYSVVYVLFSIDLPQSSFIIVFLIYGVYYGLTEAAEKAWMVDLAPVNLKGTALGIYNSIVGFGSLPASLLFGIIWQKYSSHSAFIFGSICSVIGTLMIILIQNRSKKLI